MGLQNQLNGKVSHLGKSSQAGHPSAERMRTESGGPYSHPSLCHRLYWNRTEKRKGQKGAACSHRTSTPKVPSSGKH